MSKVFFISGLGADYRLFKHLKVDGFEPVYVHWLEPNGTDTLTSYAQRIISECDITSGSVVIGVSLGGMLTMEVAKQIKLQQAIIISSIKTINAAPFYFGLFKALPVQRLVPEALIKLVGKLAQPLFGYMYKQDAQLFRQMIADNSPKFIKWAMDAVLQWQNTEVPANVYHIHGTKDLIFPYQKVKADALIKGGTHMMVFDRAAEVNAVIKQVLEHETA